LEKRGGGYSREIYDKYDMNIVFAREENPGIVFGHEVPFFKERDAAVAGVRLKC